MVKATEQGLRTHIFKFLIGCGYFFFLYQATIFYLEKKKMPSTIRIFLYSQREFGKPHHDHVKYQNITVYNSHYFGFINKPFVFQGRMLRTEYDVWKLNVVFFFIFLDVDSFPHLMVFDFLLNNGNRERIRYPPFSLLKMFISYPETFFFWFKNGFRKTVLHFPLEKKTEDSWSILQMCMDTEFENITQLFKTKKWENVSSFAFFFNGWKPSAIWRNQSLEFVQ